ncbi:MAG: helicase [Candidatus Dadabacteria bacterium]|nr:MAG: helicase [Candidatus Dadabacteria bacterium]
MEPRWIDPARIYRRLRGRRPGPPREGRVDRFAESWEAERVEARGVVTLPGQEPHEAALFATPTRVGGTCGCGGRWPCGHLVVLARRWADEAARRAREPAHWRPLLDALVGRTAPPAGAKRLAHWVAPAPAGPTAGLLLHWRLHRVRPEGLGPGRVVAWEGLEEALSRWGEAADREVARRVGGLVAAGARRVGPGVRVDPRDVDAVLRCLADAEHVFDQRTGKPLQIRLDPAPLRLRVEARGQGFALRAELGEGAALVVGDRAPWVWGAEDLRPVPRVRSGAALGQLVREGAAVEPEEVPALLGTASGALEAAGIPLDLEGFRIERVLVDETPRPRVYLEEDEGRLVARLAFRYGDLEIPADNPDPTPRMSLGGRSVYVRRDMDAEFHATRRLMEAGLTLVEPGWFAAEGEDALGFLLDGVRDLGEEWAVFGAERLVRWRVRPKPVVLRLRARTGIDWLEVEAGAEADGVPVGVPRLLEALRRGERYVRLDDGSFARVADGFQDRALRALEDLRVGAGPARFPRHMAPLVEELAELAEEAEWEGRELWAATLRRLADARTKPIGPVPGLRATLRPYQRTGVGWLAAAGEAGLGVVLADDMGLGKTVQALAAVASGAGSGRPSLVVAPTSVVPNWEAEARRFTPNLRVVRHHGAERGQGPEAFGDADLVITSYALLRRDRELLAGVEWDWAILDEAQAIKNPDTQTARAARALRARRRLALTGTPLENHLGEIWSLFQFLNPGLLGSQRSFARRFVQPILSGDEAAAEALRRRVAPFVLRRLKSEVEPELPPKVEAVLWCEMEPEQEALYRSILEASRRQVEAAIRRSGFERARMSVLEALLRLRQACTLPAVLPGGVGEGVPSAKFDRFRSFMAETIEEGHRVLVFSQFTQVLSRLRDWCEQAGYRPLYLDGRTRKREEKVRRFQEDGSVRVFLISLKAGGAGLNLTGADYVVLFDPWWNPAVEAQATDRTHRIGQTRKVFSYRMVVRGTVEEKMLELQARKRGLLEAVLGPDGAGPLSEEDVRDLLGIEG